jgi:L-aspartate oxidase
MERKMQDVMVLGTGVAGFSLAIGLAEARPDLSISVIAKSSSGESNTRYAQGGVAAVWDQSLDSFDKHIMDTLEAGDGLCRREVVEFVVKEGPESIQSLIEWGARFDRELSGQGYDLAKEGGHSASRILHYKDLTGYEIQRALLEKVASIPNIVVYENIFAIDLITQHHLGYTVTRVTPDIECYGIYAYNCNNHKIETWLSKCTILATGGLGQVYKNTTNPLIATGDGIAMVYRAKGRVNNMEMVQFHPTAFYNVLGENPSFLISEAVRGFGGELKKKDGTPFMHEYDSRGSLAPRDIVARAIDHEMKASGEDCVYLDCRHLPRDSFQNHFPTIYEHCKNNGIDVFKDMIPVVPACHYACGGIEVDKKGRTSIKGLYASGECAHTGLHGANRLASNSLLEALVYSARIKEDIMSHIDQRRVLDGIPDWNDQGATAAQEMVLITQSRRELKDIMSSYVGIVRNDLRLDRASNRLHLLYLETESLYQRTTISPQLCELRNLITIAYLITRSSQLRKESRGLQYNTDYPFKKEHIEDSLL